jgi:predicted TIM-barrel fold metal-dependent hydrolase
MTTDYRDFHTHVGNWRFDVNHTRIGQIKKELNAHGFEKFVVMISAPENPESTHSANITLMREAIENRLDFIYWLDPRVTKLSELDSVASKIKGVKLHPSYARTRIDSRKMVKFLEWCSANSKPLLVHCGRWNKYAAYQYAVDVAVQHELTLVLAHMGGPAYDIKTNALDYIAKQKLKARLVVDTSTCFQPYLIEKATRILGPDNVILGSDYPLYHPRPTADTILMSSVSTRAKRLILRDNYDNL